MQRYRVIDGAVRAAELATGDWLVLTGAGEAVEIPAALFRALFGVDGAAPAKKNGRRRGRRGADQEGGLTLHEACEKVLRASRAAPLKAATITERLHEMGIQTTQGSVSAVLVRGRREKHFARHGQKRAARWTLA